MVFLMNALKSIEIGSHISMAQSVSASDTLVATVLSSIGSVASRQDALLRSITNSDTSLVSFDTPLSDTWAYNLALGFVESGSCVVELPITILPTLHSNNRTAGLVRPGSRIMLEWDDAGRAAALRSGNPLFIGWVNQIDAPVYTPLMLVGDNTGSTDIPVGLSGTAFAVLTAQPGLTHIDALTEATLAGPFIACILK
jgi:hypothetical protein